MIWWRQGEQHILSINLWEKKEGLWQGGWLAQWSNASLASRGACYEG